MKGNFSPCTYKIGGDFQNIWKGGGCFSLEPENTAYSILASLFVPINPFTVKKGCQVYEIW